jgi:hypothetical protein
VAVHLQLEHVGQQRLVLVEGHKRQRRLGFQPARDQVVDAFPQVRVEALPRQGHHDGDRRRRCMGPRHDADGPAFGAHERVEDVRQPLRPGGEQRVLGQRLQRRAQHPLVVGVGDDVLRGDDLLDPLAQQRDGGHRLGRRLLGEQAEHAPQAVLAGGAGERDDVDHPLVPVDGAAAVGERHRQCGPVRLQRGAQGQPDLHVPGAAAVVVVQHPQAAAGVEAAAITVDVVVRRAEEHEVAVDQPAHEGRGLVGAGALVELVGDLRRPSAHGVEVAGGALRVVQHRTQRRGNLLEALVVEPPGQLDVDPGLTLVGAAGGTQVADHPGAVTHDPELGVRAVGDRELHAVQLTGDRRQQERSVLDHQ